jgi:RND family efflux transporter MFP subunit
VPATVRVPVERGYRRVTADEPVRAAHQQAAAHRVDEWAGEWDDDVEPLRGTQIDLGEMLAEEEAVRVADFNRLKADLEVKTAENKIEELKVKREETQLKLAEHEIKAPFAGMVVKRHVTGGETIGATATPLFELADLSNLIAWISRPQRELAMVRGAKEVLFTADAYPGQQFTADVDLVSPVVDQATGSFRVRMRVRPADAPALVAGLFIRARILTEDLREALMVPKAAVLAEGDRSIVFVVRDDHGHKVTLDAGLEERDWVECRNRGDDGLRPDDRVVVSGHEDLRDQAVVEVSKD